MVTQMSLAAVIVCGVCRATLLQPRVSPQFGGVAPLFTNVYPLPSDAWYELNETLSCHVGHIADQRLVLSVVFFSSIQSYLPRPI